MSQLHKDGKKNPQAFAIAMSVLGRACGVEGKLGSPEEIVKAKSEARLHEYEQSVDDEGYIHDDEGNVEFVGKKYAGQSYGLHGAPSGRPVNRFKVPSPEKKAKLDAENEARAKKRRKEDQTYALEVSLDVLGPDKRIEGMLGILKSGKDLSTNDLLYVHNLFTEPNNAWLLNAKLGRNPSSRFSIKGYDPGPRTGKSRYTPKSPSKFGFEPKKTFEGKYIPLDALFM